MSSISLRSFGYSTTAPEATRRAALQKAINHHGFDAVESRIDEILSYKYNAKMEDDWEWLNIMRPESVVATPTPIASVRLSTFGYSTKLPDAVRHQCLLKAVEKAGQAEIVKRLGEVADLAAPNTNKKNTLMADKAWLTNPKPEPATPPAPNVATPPSSPNADFILDKIQDMIIVNPYITLKEAIPLIEKMWARKQQTA